MSIARVLPKIKRVAVLGGGPSGVVAAKCLLSEGLIPVIYEQRPTFGGVWNYTPETKSRLQHIPQEDPNLDDEPVPDAQGSGKPVFISPIYDELETNIPKDLMTFNQTPFGRGLQLFPTHEDTKLYVQEFSKGLEEYTKFNRRVIRLVRQDGLKWEVETREVVSAETEKETFDAVVIATGHYNVPYIPPISGIEEFERRHPGSILHSKYFRAADGYTGKRVIVVGNSASGIDISTQISEVSQIPLYQSCRSVGAHKDFPLLAPEKIKVVPTIERFVPEGRTIIFSDGTIEKDIDIILFCTGYLHSFPFLEESTKPSERMVTDGFYIHRLYQHIFYIPYPTLSVVGLPTKIIPFPFVETQAAVISGVYSGRLNLPSEGDMDIWEKDLLQKKPADRHFHFLGFPQDADYMDMLNNWNEEEADKNGTLYKPSQWRDKERWIRKNIPKIKAAFLVAKAEGRIVKTMGELGFHYDGEGKAETSAI
ncbi:hypothetical protein TWF730_009424 [Orbilia blumenaviensis]|uniref:Flavin-containing monooxygenase n=1 Tax=Orbilia blumenaviensis TaxID=1796055 RepID=A0AAV9UY88_9PEZI